MDSFNPNIQNMISDAYGWVWLDTEDEAPIYESFTIVVPITDDSRLDSVVEPNIDSGRLDFLPREGCSFVDIMKEIGLDPCVLRHKPVTLVMPMEKGKIGLFAVFADSKIGEDRQLYALNIGLLCNILNESFSSHTTHFLEFNHGVHSGKIFEMHRVSDSSAHFYIKQSQLEKIIPINFTHLSNVGK